MYVRTVYMVGGGEGGGGKQGQGPLIVGIMQIKNAKYILDTPLPVYVPTQLQCTCILVGWNVELYPQCFRYSGGGGLGIY